MREPKRSQKSSPGVGTDQPPSARTPTPSTTGSCGPSPSPSPGQPPPSVARPPRTPKHEPLDSPWYPPPPPLHQPATPKGIVKNEPLSDGPHADALSNPPSVSMPSPAPGAGVMSATSNLIVPSSPLDQFRKEDPMEKMAQMTSSLGTAGGPGSGGGSLLMSLRSPSSLSPGTPHSHIPSPIPNGLSRPSVITQQQQQLQHYGPGPAGMVGSPQPPPRMGPATALVNQGPTVPEQPYMQQQSVVFVFNTGLANRAADLVNEGHFGSIIDVHMQEEATKRFLSQHGLKRPAGANSMSGPALRPCGAGWPPDGSGAARHGGPLPAYRPQLAGKGATAQPPPHMLGMGGQTQAMEQPGSVEARGNDSKQAKLDKLRQLERKFLPPEETAEMNGIPYGMQMPPSGQPQYAGVPMRQGAGKNMGGPPGAGAQGKRSGGSARQTFGSAANAEQLARLGSQELSGMMASPNGSGDLGGLADMRLSPNFLYAAELSAGEAANVMPVPSPQPIQYISGQFDAQELVIQKQPNRSYMRSHPGAPGELPMQQQPPGHGNMMLHRQASMNGIPRGKNAGTMEQANMMVSDQFAAGPMAGYSHSVAGGAGHPSAQQQYSTGHPAQQSPGPGGPFPDPVYSPNVSQTHHQQQQHPMPQQPAMDPCLNVRMRGPYPGPGGHMAFDAPRPSLHGDPHAHAQGHAPQSHSAPQTVNNTYVNAHMTIEHVNIQNMPYENTQYSHSHSQSSLSYSAPGMEPVQMARGVSQVQLSHQQAAGRPQQMMDNPPGYPAPYDGPLQIAIKPNAPNTIQYLPSRPPPPRQPRAPPNLDFLQQWTGGPGPAPRPTNAAVTQPAQFRGPNVHMSVSGGPPGGGMYAAMDGSAVNMNINNPGFASPSPAPNGGMMGMGGPGGMGDERYSSYQDFQQQLYATNVGGARATGPAAPGSAAGMAAPGGGGGGGKGARGP